MAVKTREEATENPLIEGLERLPVPVTIDQQGPQKGDMRDTYADTSRARADLGFAPSVTLEEGLRRDPGGGRRHRCGHRRRPPSPNTIG